MSLRQFLEYHSSCPLCKSDLNLIFNSRKKQIITQHKDHLTIESVIHTFNHKEKLNINYNFSLINNKFWVEFPDNTKIKTLKNKSSLRDLKKFEDYNLNIKSNMFYRLCTSCNKYIYYSNGFLFDLAMGTYGEIIVEEEGVGLLKLINNNYNIFKLYNIFINNKSVIEYGKTTNKQAAEDESLIQKPFMRDNQLILFPDIDINTIEFSLIPFTTEQEIIEKLCKLTIFF